MSSQEYDMDEIYDQVRGILGEHFHSFCFIVSDEDGEIFFDYTNFRVGKMLMREALEDLNTEMDDVEFIWDEEEDEDEWEDDGDEYEYV